VSTFLSVSDRGKRGFHYPIHKLRTSLTDFLGNSVAVAYLPPSVLQRPNLTVAVTTIVEKVLFDESGAEPRAIGVEVSKSPISPKYRIKANREVILSGGAVATPHILLLSGIGPQEDLTKVGIKVVKELPQVGKNYYDVSGILHPEVFYSVTTAHSIFLLVPSACEASLATRSTSSTRLFRQPWPCYSGLCSEKVQ
jgi:choline dehydrogenase-like flavoprotein